jgi:hypothetical protein
MSLYLIARSKETTSGDESPANYVRVPKYGLKPVPFKTKAVCEFFRKG